MLDARVLKRLNEPSMYIFGQIVIGIKDSDGVEYLQRMLLR